MLVLQQADREEDFDVGHEFQSRPQQQVESMDPEESLQHQKDVLPYTAPQNPSSANRHMMPVRREPKGKGLL